MESNYSKEITSTSFLQDTQSFSVFAKLDYSLRNSFHIQQQHPEQDEMFGFISREEIFESMRLYYKQYFNLNLEKRGVPNKRYYFLSFQAKTRKGVPYNNREELKPAYVIIGLLICKIFFVDVREFSSESQLLEIIREDYELYLNDLNRLLAFVENEETSLPEEDRIAKIFKSSIKKFIELGWIYKNLKGQLEIMPSMDRLRDLYINEIMDIPNKVLKVYK